MKLPDFVAVRQTAPKAPAQSQRSVRAEQPKENHYVESKESQNDQSFKSNLRQDTREHRTISREEQRSSSERAELSKEKALSRKESVRDEEVEAKGSELNSKSKVLREEVKPEELEQVLKDLEDLSQQEDVSLDDILVALSSLSEDLKSKLSEFRESNTALSKNAEAKSESAAKNLLIDLSAGEKSLKIHLVDNPAQTKLQVQVKENLIPLAEETVPPKGLSQQEDLMKPVESEVLDGELKVHDKVVNQEALVEAKNTQAQEQVDKLEVSGRLEPPKGLEIAEEKAEGSKAQVSEVIEKLAETGVEKSKLDESPKLGEAVQVKKSQSAVDVSKKLSASKVTGEMPVLPEKKTLDIPKENVQSAAPKTDLSKLQSEVKSFEFTVKKTSVQQEAQSSPLKRLAEATHSLQTKHNLQQDGQNLSQGDAQEEEEGFKFEKELTQSFKKLRSILHRHSDMDFGQALTSQNSKAMAKPAFASSMTRLQTQILDKLNQNLPKLVADHSVKMSLDVQNVDLGNVRITIEQSGNQLNINVQGDRALNQLLTQARNELQSQIKMDGFENLDLNMNFGDESKNEQEQQGNEDASRVTLAGEESEDIMSLFEQSSKRFFEHIEATAS